MKKDNVSDVTAENTKKFGFFGDIIDKCYMYMDNRKIKWSVIAALVIVAVTFPMYSSNYWISVFQNAMFMALLAMSLNIIVGYTGMFHLGFAAKFAIGAYISAILVRTFEWNFWLTLPVAVIGAVIAAVVIGGPTLRLRSDYLAIVTLGFGEIVRITARNLQITGAASGLSGISRPHLFGIHITSVTNWYYVFLVLVVIYIMLSYRIKYSRFGRALQYIREDEDAAQAMGINTPRYKLFAFILASVMGAVAGSFFAVRMGSISPTSFQFLQSVNVLLAVVIGGMGKIPGVILGAIFITVFPELFRGIPFVSDARMLSFGVLLVLAMMRRPQGLWPERRR
jgi:branched-chain amino acid transport system permease protein